MAVSEIVVEISGVEIAQEAVAVAERALAYADDLADKLAAEYLANEALEQQVVTLESTVSELGQRLSWYRGMLRRIGHAVAGGNDADIKRAALLAEYKLNSES